jgi:hypothetical protein
MTADSSGSGITGQIQGAKWTASGKYGSALSFDGNSSYVDLGSPAVLSQSTGSMTWTAWVYPAGTPPDDGQIVALSDDNSGWQLKTTPDTGPRTFGIAISEGGSSHTQRYSNTVISLNKWYHVAGVYNAGAQTLDIYVNGILDDGVLVGIVPSSQVVPAIDATIGMRSGGYYFNGVIDNLRIYNRALSASEIQLDMNTPVGASSGGTTLPTISSLQCSPTALGSGGSTACTLAISQPAPSGGTVAALSSSNASLTVPAAVTIPANATSAVFTAAAGAVSTNQSVTVTAAISGSSRSTTVNLTAAPAVSSITCSPATITFGSSSSCAITLSQPPANGATVTLQSNNMLLTVPAAITVVAGATTAIFMAVAVSISPGQISGAQSATITAAMGKSSASVTLTLALQPAPPSSTSPAAAYGFDEGTGITTSDASGNGNTGHIHGAGWTAESQYGDALSFSGAGSYVDLGNPASLQSTGSMTWSAWVYITGAPAGDGEIIARSGDADGWQLKTSLDTGQRSFAVAISNGSSLIQRYSNTVPALYTWYYVAGVYDANAQMLDIYVNGVLDDGAINGAVPASQSLPNLNTTIGKRSDGFNFIGIIDEVRVYNQALAQQQIRNDMNTPVNAN